MKIYNEKATRVQTRAQFKEKKSNRKCNTSQIIAQGHKRFKTRTYSKWNKESDALRARPQTAELPTWEKELKESLSSRENNQQEKAYANVIQGGCQGSPALASRITMQFRQGDFGFRIHNTGKCLWTLGVGGPSVYLLLFFG